MTEAPLDNITFNTYTDRKGLELAISFLGDAEYSMQQTSDKLVAKGYTDFQTSCLINQALMELDNRRKSKAIRNIVIGALFLVAGTVLTLANIGLIFWGAIVFGGIQMVQGIVAISLKKEITLIDVDE